MLDFKFWIEDTIDFLQKYFCNEFCVNFRTYYLLPITYYLLLDLVQEV